VIYFRESINLNYIVKIVQEILKEDGQKKEGMSMKRKIIIAALAIAAIFAAVAVVSVLAQIPVLI
jgi:hypothetical protein